MIHQKIITSALLIIIFAMAYLIIDSHQFQSVLAQRDRVTGIDTTDQTATETLGQNQTFRSAFDTFVTSEPLGYGVYEERLSNTFRPGETMVLYIEPVGFEYGTLTDEGGNTIYAINFTADFTISDAEGNVLTGQQNIPVSEIISHRQNKEVFIPFTITQTSPFPPGNYIITYTIHDNNSGESFDIVKEISVSDERSF